MKGKFYPYPGATNLTAYAHLNDCTDPDQRLERLMWGRVPIAGKLVLDVGAGSGFHAVRYAQKANHVFAAEPDPRMLQQIYARLCNNPLGNISILAASAESIPLPDNFIDIAHARFAYFFGTEDCLPGLHEVRRILKPGAHFFIIDVNPDRGLFGKTARAVYPHVFHEKYHQEHTLFYREQGFSHVNVDTVFRAPDREVLAEVFRMEYQDKAPEILKQIQGTELSYSLFVYHWQKGNNGSAQVE
ncbi:MAG: class I SAM-dependent methyltransferase [Candidatus Poribacteria bacterium]|nr:class I SAM-dependent methyltransferase [Candidatus Poribacteria bacterium]